MVPLDCRIATSSGWSRHYAFARFWNDTAATERPRTEESSICSLSDQANRTPSVILVAAMEANPQKGLSTPCRHTSGSPHHRSKGEERLQSFWPVGWKIWPEDRASRSPEAKMAHPAHWDHSGKWSEVRIIARHDAPHPDILRTCRQLIRLQIPCHVHWPRSYCQSRAHTADICRMPCFWDPAEDP